MKVSFPKRWYTPASIAKWLRARGFEPVRGYLRGNVFHVTVKRKSKTAPKRKARVRGNPSDAQHERFKARLRAEIEEFRRLNERLEKSAADARAFIESRKRELQDAPRIKSNPGKEKGIKVGSRVMYSRAFLRSTGMLSGVIPHARGVVTAIDPKFGGGLATVDWGTPDVPARVLVANLALAGKPEKNPGRRSKGGTEIYPAITAIEGRKHGRRYRHTFKAKPRALGQKDGSVVLRGQKRIWGVQ